MRPGAKERCLQEGRFRCNQGRHRVDHGGGGRVGRGRGGLVPHLLGRKVRGRGRRRLRRKGPKGAAGLAEGVQVLGQVQKARHVQVRAEKSVQVQVLPAPQASAKGSAARPGLRGPEGRAEGRHAVRHRARLHSQAPRQKVPHAPRAQAPKGQRRDVL